MPCAPPGTPGCWPPCWRPGASPRRRPPPRTLERERKLTLSPHADEGHGQGGGAHPAGHRATGRPSPSSGTTTWTASPPRWLLTDYLRRRRRHVPALYPPPGGGRLRPEPGRHPPPAGPGGHAADHRGLRHHRRWRRWTTPGSLGMDVVVTDHHECKETAARGPWRWWTPTGRTARIPFKHLAGVGVALKLVLALGGESREDALFARYCTLAAIGTIADVMLMEGENRTIVSCGLEALPHTDFAGHPRPAAGGGPFGQAHHLRPGGLCPLPPDQRRRADGGGGSGGGAAGVRRPGPGGGIGPGALRS